MDGQNYTIPGKSLKFHTSGIFKVQNVSQIVIKIKKNIILIILSCISSKWLHRSSSPLSWKGEEELGHLSLEVDMYSIVSYKREIWQFKSLFELNKPVKPFTEFSKPYKKIYQAFETS